MAAISLLMADGDTAIETRVRIPPIMITPIGHHDRSEATRVVG
jgi:hypothetical protein